MKDETSTSDYEWRNGRASCSHDYLVPILDRIVEGYRKKRNIPVSELRIFDVGCGNGFLVGNFLSRGFEAAGCDASASGITIAKGKHPRACLEVMSCYDDMTAVFGCDWDVVVSSEVIEHLYDPKTFVRRARELLRPGGLLIVTTPYHGYLKNLALAVTGNLDRHFTVLWDGGHIKFWSFKTLRKLLAEYGFSDIEFIGAGRAPYLWKSMIVTSRKPI